MRKSKTTGQDQYDEVSMQQRKSQSLDEKAKSPNVKEQRKFRQRTICCLKIQPYWSIQKQLLISLLVLSSIIYAFVIAIVFINLYLTKSLLISQSKEAIQVQNQRNLENQAQVYSATILQELYNQAETLDIFNKIILAALMEDNTLYDFNVSKAFPVLGPNYNVTIFQEVPSGLVTKNKQLNNYYNEQVTLLTWTWAAFSSSDKVSMSLRGQQIYTATDVTNNIIGDLFYDKKINGMELIYFSFVENEFTTFFPGGVVQLGLDTRYMPSNRPWFKNVQQQLGKIGTFGNNFYYDPILTMYQDFISLNDVLTISLPIINFNNEFVGCSNIDVFITELEKIINIQAQVPGTYTFFVTGYGSILNNPYKEHSNVMVNSTNITKITNETWTQVSDWAVVQQQNTTVTNSTTIFYTQNSENEELLLVASITILPQSRQYYLVMVIKLCFYLIKMYVPQSIAYMEAYSLENDMQDQFTAIEANTIITIAATCGLAILIAYYFSYRIVKPLSDLTQYAQQINENIKNQKQGLKQNQRRVQLQDIRAQDKIGELVDVFKNLIQGLAGLKKGNVNYYYLISFKQKRDGGNQQLIKFPLNTYNNTTLPWEDQISQLKDKNELFVQIKKSDDQRQQREISGIEEKIKRAKQRVEGRVE